MRGSRTRAIEARESAYSGVIRVESLLLRRLVDFEALATRFQCYIRDLMRMSFGHRHQLLGSQHFHARRPYRRG